MKSRIFWLIILSFLLGVLLSIVIKFPLEPALAKYLGVALLAALDTICGGVRAWLEKQFDENIFISGFIFNAFIASFLTYLGDRIGVDLYLVAVIAFGLRIFQNLSYIRRHLLEQVK
jgi:small basic protein